MESTPQIDLTKLTLEGLKSLAYDFIAQKETAEANLRQVNIEITKRFQAPQVLPQDLPVAEAEVTELPTPKKK